MSLDCKAIESKHNRYQLNKAKLALYKPLLSH